MQSLLLATSIALTSPVSISTLSDTDELTKAVQQEVSTVRKVVEYKTKVDIQDSYFFQAAQSIKLAKKLSAAQPDVLGE